MGVGANDVREHRPRGIIIIGVRTDRVDASDLRCGYAGVVDLMDNSAS